MRAIDVREARELAAEAARAPSVHNVQPARWRFLPGGRAAAVPRRDPHAAGRRSQRARRAAQHGSGVRGHGAGAVEARHRPRRPRARRDAPRAGPRAGRPRRRSSTVRPRIRSPSACRSAARSAACSRPSPAASSRALADSADVRVVVDRATIRELAARYDRSSLGFLRQPAYLRELYDWCRFSPRHPRWDRDGLNADCLALSTAGTHRRPRGSCGRGSSPSFGGWGSAAW